MTRFIVNFSKRLDISASNTRLAYLTFAGPNPTDPSKGFKTLNQNLNLTDFNTSVNFTLFSANLLSLSPVGGTTDTAGALDFVRTSMLTPENYRPGTHRVVILATDGFPTDSNGSVTTAASRRAGGG
jgi:hypothetical protein